jgi:hypothetical protein
MRDDVGRPQPARGGREDLDHARGEVEGVYILSERLLDPGAEHLDRHFLAGVGEPRAVDLRDGGGRDGFAEIREEVIDPHVELALHGPLRGCGGKRGQLVLQDAELHGEVVADDVGAGRQDLSELDVGRAERRQRPRRGRQRRIAAIAEPCEGHAQNAGRDPQAARRLERVEHDLHGSVRSSVAPVRISRQMLWGPRT